MKLARAVGWVCVFALLAGVSLRAQSRLLAARGPAPLDFGQRAGARTGHFALRAAGQNGAGIGAPRGFRKFVVKGKLTLSLENAILLALENNTNVQLDRTPLDLARDAVERAHAPFDPGVTTSFQATRTTSPAYTQLQGAPSQSNLQQNASVGYNQTFETGTNVQVGLSANKLSTNNTFNFINPSVVGNFSFTFTQPLLRGGGLFANRAPIVIAQRGLSQARQNFQAQVNDIIQNVVTQYWNVVAARENLAVQKGSLAEAQRSYQHDEHALRLGALPPLDIYRSESQVAQRKVAVVQAQYAVLLAEDQFRDVIGADLDSAIRALPLNLTDLPAPSEPLFTMGFSTALEKALKNRPEIASMREQLQNDRTSIRLARNQTLPNLSLMGTYQSNGVGGDLINTNVVPPVVISTGGFGDAFDQVFRFGYPVYGGGFTLSLPIRNREAEANLGDALAARRHDLYSERQLRQAITLDVTTAVQQLEQAKSSMEASKISYKLAQKNLAAEQRKYELGAEQIFFVLEAQTELAQAEQSLVESEVSYQLAVTAVEHATGGLLSQYNVQIRGLER